MPAGTAIVTEGEFNDGLFVVMDGRVRVTKEGRRPGPLSPRDFFGEMALLDGETRSATGDAVGPVRLLRLSRDGAPADHGGAAGDRDRDLPDALAPRPRPARGSRPAGAEG